MATPSSSSRENRIRVLVRILVMRLIRGAFGAIPWFGSALDNVVFGIRESLATKELERRLDELLGQIKTLSDEHNVNIADQRRGELDLPAAVELEEFLNRLSDSDYRDAEDRTLRYLGEVDHSADITAEKLKLALDSIVLADEALQRQIALLRDLERVSVEGIAKQESLRDFVTMSRSVRRCLEIRERYGEPTWYLDLSVLFDYLSGPDERPDTVEPAVSRYLIKNAPPNSLKIPGAQVGTLVDRIDAVVRDAQAVKCGTLNRLHSQVVSIREFMTLPQKWRGEELHLSVASTLELREFTRIVMERLDRAMGMRFRQSYRVQRLYALASAMAEARADCERPGASGIAVLVARGRSLLPSLEGIAGEFPNCIVTHSYGPAWLCFLDRETPAASALAAREIGCAVTSIEAATLPERLDSPKSRLRNGWEKEVRKHMPQFLRAANEFHHAVAEEVDRFREEMLDAAGAWTDRLSEGSQQFGSLLAWLDTLPDPDSPVRWSPPY